MTKLNYFWHSFFVRDITRFTKNYIVSEQTFYCLPHMYFDSLRKETMDSDDDLKIFPLVSGGGRGDEVSMSLDDFISKNGLVR